MHIIEQLPVIGLPGGIETMRSTASTGWNGSVVTTYRLLKTLTEG